MNKSTAPRKTKRHPAPPPPPSPKVLHFPRSRRTRRKQTRTAASRRLDQNGPPLLLMRQKYQSHKATLEKLFNRENDDPPTTHGLAPSVSYSESPTSGRRERVEEDDCGEYFNGAGGGFEEEKWKFQSEILRAECKLLRMEREFALKKMEKNRVNVERTLKSAVQALVSGRKKIFEGKNVNDVLDEEIEDLAEKLEELQKSSRSKEEFEVQNCSNFDKSACLLQRRLENLKGLSSVKSRKDSQNGAELSLCVDANHEGDKESNISNWKTEDKLSDVDFLRDKMEGLSKGILNRVEEEYNSILSITANGSESVMANENKCTGRCKAIVRRIVEQVRAETEQWAQMQEMLAQVRGEMEELQASRDFWENRAYNLNQEIRALRNTVEEWKEKAIRYENKANETSLEISTLKEQTRNPNTDLSLPPPFPLGKQLEKEKIFSSFRLKKNSAVDEKGRNYENGPEEELKTEESSPKKGLPEPLSLGKQLAKEKRKILRHLKENPNRVHADDVSSRERASKREVPISVRRKKSCSSGFGILDPSRSPLMDISSLSPLTRQISRSAFFGFLSPESSRIRGSFRM
ncbi:myosin-related family protein [Striga asiatica]|uniref:Myosin-related family protein n=1 Tax=Striga asiatica TaxID=4170 RepID=A0A5A7RBG8_STRAF|nr:myosin-related family protein [Striga asiatica]